MGQKFFEDKIGALSQSSGTILVGPSFLTVGGQQYYSASLSRAISSDVTMTANSRYQIFAVIVGGSLSLRISANENSVGPAGFTAWKLVGSFYSNGLSPVAFGSFVNIEGVPSTNTISYTPVWTATTTNPVINNGTLAGTYSIRGNIVELTIRTYMGTTTTYGSGNYMWSIPFSLDTSAYQSGYSFMYSYGQATFLRAGVQTYDGALCAPADSSITKVSMQYQSVNTYVNPTNPNTFANTDEIFGHGTYPAVGLSNTPIKDR